MESSEPDPTTYTPEAQEAARRIEERRLVHEGTEIWRARKEELQRQKLLEQFQLRRMLANYWPWGRPGGGAPCASALRKRNVPLEPVPSQTPEPPLPQCWRIKSAMDRKTPNKELTFNSLSRNGYDLNNDYWRLGTTIPGPPPSEDPWKRRDEQVYRVTGGGVELAPLLTSGGGGSSRRQQQQQQQHRSARQHVVPDATRPGYVIDSWRALNAASGDYVAELAQQIRQKRDRSMEERLRESENCRRHFDTWRGLWGRPGHGAPIDHARRRRNNLHDILHRTACPARLEAAVEASPSVH